MPEKAAHTPSTEDNNSIKRKKWNYDEKMHKWIQSLPKVELHVHLDGSFDPLLLKEHLDGENGDYNALPEETVLPWEMNDTTDINDDDEKNESKNSVNQEKEKTKKGVLPVRQLVMDCETKLDFHSLCTCRGKYSLAEMLKCFEIFLPIVRGNLDLLEELAYDFVKRQYEQNVYYTEVRYSPHLLAENNSSLSSSSSGNSSSTTLTDADAVVDAITKGLRRGEKEFDCSENNKCSVTGKRKRVKVNQILCCITWRPDWAEDVVRIANERKDDYPCSVVGIDIAAGEEHFDEENFPHLHGPHYQAFQKAQELGLNVTLHAGEVGDLTNIVKAVEQYGASRIGHGYHIVKDVKLMEYLREKDIHFEVCPTSSVETGGWDYDKTKPRPWENHPATQMKKYGLSLNFNSDDPAVFNTSMIWQLKVANTKMGFTQNCLVDTIYKSIDAAFCSSQEKEDLKEHLKEYLVHVEKKNEQSDLNHQEDNEAYSASLVDQAQDDCFKDRVIRWDLVNENNN